MNSVAVLGWLFGVMVMLVKLVKLVTVRMF